MVNVHGEEHDSHFYTKLGAISSLVINEQHLVYSTLFGGGGHLWSGDRRPTFNLFEQLDFFGFENTVPV